MNFRLLASMTAVLALGCDSASGPAPGAQLPPGILDKRLFESDRGFYYQKTYLEMPVNPDPAKVPLTYPAPISPLRKIRWEMQEHWLVAYRFGETVTGSTDGAGAATTVVPEMSFPVEHLDVFLNQAAATPGRPWYQRSHILVDWAHPALEGTGYIELSQNVLKPERFWVSDPSDRDAPIFGDGYIDVTVKETLEFSALVPYGYDTAFWCQDRDNPNCTGGRISYRLSFMRVPQTDYVPLRVKDVLSENTFPVFRVAQSHFDDQYGFTDTGRTQLALRFDLYQRSHDDEGALIPERDRQTRQQAVYLTPNMPDDLRPVVSASLALWNSALRDALNARRKLDCARAGCTPTLLDGWNFFAECPNNPVREGDPEVCGPAGTAARMGDVRYLLLQWNENIGVSVPLATAYWAADPDTGELVGGLVNLSGVMLDRQAMAMVDAVRLLNGDKALRDAYLSGKSELDWVDARRGDSLVGESVLPLRTGTPLPLRPVPPPEPPHVASGAALPTWTWGLSPSAPRGLPDARTLNGPFGRPSPAIDLLVAEATLGRQRREALQGSAFEAALLDPETLAYQGENPFSPADPAKLDRLSPLRAWDWWHRDPKATDSFALDTYFADGDLADVAAQYVNSAPLDVFREVRKQQVAMVLTHELGHLLSLRHNFAGSYDAFNYFDQYWELRNDGAMGPRWVDPVSPAERAGKQRRQAYSSVMDYFAGPTDWKEELGRYDKAVIKWLYGGLVEVMNGPKNKANAASLNQLIFWNRFYAPTPLIPAPDGSKLSLHYTDLPRFFDLANRVDFPVDELVNRFGNPEVEAGTGATATPDGRVMAPWHMCTEEAPPVNGCHEQDVGADPYEVITDYSARARGYYLFTHFRRGLTGFPGRRAGVDLLALDEVNRLLLSSTVTQILINDPSYFVPGEGLEAYSQALAAAFDTLGENLTMPDVGQYALGSNADGLQLYQRDDSGALPLDFDRARFYSSKTLTPSDTAINYLKQLSRIGWAGDKNTAVDLLSFGPNVSGQLGINEVQSPRQSIAGFYKFFPAQVNMLFGRLLSGEVRNVAPAWDGTAVVRPRISDPAWAPPVGASTIDPAVPLAVKLRIVTTGYPSLFKSSSNRSFADLARIWVAGSGAAVTGPVTVSWVDALTLKTYVAISFPVGAEETGIGARLLLRAQRLETRSLTAPTPEERALAAQTLEEVRYLIEYTRTVVEAVERGQN